LAARVDGGVDCDRGRGGDGGDLALPLAPAPGAISVRHATRTAALVTLRGGALGFAAGRARADAAAVPLAAIAAAAQQHLRTAARAHEQTGGMIDGQAPRDDSRGAPMAARKRRVRPHIAAYTWLASRYLARL